MAIESSEERGASFPLIGPALVVLALHGVLGAINAPDPLPSAMAVVAAFAVGYCALALIAAGRIPLSSAEVLAFTVGLAILVTALGSLAVSLVGIPISRFIVVAIGLPLGVLAFLTQHPADRTGWALSGFVRTWFDFSDYTTGEKRIAAVLLVASAVALGGFLSLSAVTYPDAPSMAIAITDSKGTSNFDATVNRNETLTVVVHVKANATPGSLPFWIRISLVNATPTGDETFHAPLATDPLRLDAFSWYNESIGLIAPGATWTKPFPIELDVEGDVTLRFELLPPSAAPPTASSRPIAETYLPLAVTPA